MTPPTARNRTTTPAAGTVRSGARLTEVVPGLDVRPSVGADRLAQRPGERVLPVGVTHVVHGWQPVCGEARVRFVFPGCTLDDAAEVCGDCAGAVTRRVPRQRTAATR